MPALILKHLRHHSQAENRLPRQQGWHASWPAPSSFVFHDSFQGSQVPAFENRHLMDFEFVRTYEEPLKS